MKKEKFISLLDEFLDSLKQDKDLFVYNLNNLDALRDADNSFIKWAQLYFKWSEVTTDMADEYYAGWNE